MTAAIAGAARPVVVLVRPFTAIAAGAAVLVGGVVSEFGASLDVWLAAASAALSVAAANAFNDLSDIDADRVNRPDRPLPAGTIEPALAGAVVIASCAASLAVALAISVLAAIWVVVLLGVAGAYSTTLQRLGFVGHVTVALLFANTLVFGSVVAGGATAATWIGATQVAGAVLGREFLKSIPDVEGDRVAGTRTSALLRGWRWSTMGFMVVNVAVWVIAAGAWLLAAAPATHLIVMSATVIAPALVLGALLLRHGPYRSIGRALDVTCLTWASGLVSVALLTLG